LKALEGDRKEEVQRKEGLVDYRRGEEVAKKKREGNLWIRYSTLRLWIAGCVMDCLLSSRGRTKRGEWILGPN